MPRGNQEAAAQVIARRGLTTRQATRLVDQLLAASGEQARIAMLTETERTSAPPIAPGPRRVAVTPGEAMIAGAAALSSRAARLQVRLLERPLASLGIEVERVVVGRLGELRTVVEALCRTLTHVGAASAASAAGVGAEDGVAGADGAVDGRTEATVVTATVATRCSTCPRDGCSILTAGTAGTAGGT